MNKQKYRILEDASEIKAEQHHKFSKAMLIKLNIGDNFNDYLDKMRTLVDYVKQNDQKNAIQEINNMYANIFYMFEEMDLDADALKHFVVCDDKKEAYEWLVSTFSKKELQEKSNSIKKKLKQSLN